MLIAHITDHQLVWTNPILHQSCLEAKKRWVVMLVDLFPSLSEGSVWSGGVYWPDTDVDCLFASVRWRLRPGISQYWHRLYHSHPDASREMEEADPCQIGTKITRVL